ncbi:hypothetical protein HD598_001316 [Neomicrococcus aestuarii]|uniref:Uncharacterized protein n=1 Tax=Neomicrococcus aestuarii TaxID=556325 RepID=A0A7W8X1C6_9MICC|nr:hypothetical protein [Neomicrococcus aestuarii]MBB5512629.1 hypothetical protein [Neomicrococcus aestuarii]
MSTISHRKTATARKSGRFKFWRALNRRNSKVADEPQQTITGVQVETSPQVTLERRIAAEILADYERRYGPWEERNN